MGDILPRFVTHMESGPATLLVVAEPEMVEEAAIKIKHQGALRLTWANFMFHPLVFCHVAFQEAPVLLAFFKLFFHTILSLLLQLSTSSAAIEGCVGL